MDSRRGDVLDVARDHDEVVYQCCGRDEGINIRQWVRDSNAAPTLRHSAVDIQNAVPELLKNVVQPPSHGKRAGWIPTADPLGSSPQFTYRQHAQEQFL